MATLSGSTVTDVPLDFADREWREFVGRSVYKRFPRGYDDVASAIADIDADDGVVRFEQQTPHSVRVSVELEYTPRDTARPDADVTQAEERLHRDLEKYRLFVQRRCDELDCRR